jgi:pullulanase/glycogen debranching enzyme
MLLGPKLNRLKSTCLCNAVTISSTYPICIHNMATTLDLSSSTTSLQPPYKMPSTSAYLTASYASPSGSHTFSHTLPTASASNVIEKTAYLSTLRSKSADLQSEINAFLTQKMEDDVKAAEGGAVKRSKKEEREEEMYGEEDPEADD